MKSRLIAISAALVSMAVAQKTPVDLSPVVVFSTSVANQGPVGTFAMPVSALRFEPRVDLQARNLAEGQADVTLRGGIFENTGFGVGAVSLTDPQTGHYYAELPIAAGMLNAPTVLTGADHALRTMASTVGSISYDWRPIANRGSAEINAGNAGLLSADVYQGRVLTTSGETRVGADVAWGHSEGDGTIALGDHQFDRVNGRVQLQTSRSQTDVFAGYQAKFFGWPNLYTPFNSAESENLQTLLVAANHRVELGAGDFAEAGVFYRRNKDDYAFNRFAALGPVHPFQHTTWLRGAAVGGRKTIGGIGVQLRGEISGDELRSTSLLFGRYHSRTMKKLAAALDQAWPVTGGNVTAKVGATYDDSNRDGGAVSPVLEVAREWTGGAIKRVYASYAGSSQLPSYTALNSSATGGLFRGNPNLGREKSRNAELGFTAALAGWSVQAAAFYREDDDLVDWTFRRGVTARAANAVDVATTGAEIVLRRSWEKLDLILGYTVLTKDADYRSATIDASFYALNFARHRLTAAVIYRFAPDWEFRFDNAARVQADNLLRQVGGDETLLSSAGLFFRPRIWRGVTFSLRSDNLWNSNFQEVPSVPAARRQVVVGVGYAW